ncbi:MAG: 2-hydroxyacid dehydrogenase [Bacteroidetes bacterium]|nr:2-hydroxyacid dehydrogenase [Bacteroidota bacterium]MCH8524545.1 2-hydroxyacid dehydrogenase [Balneolales bacterium]
MNVAVFSTKSYDRDYLNRFNQKNGLELVYFEAQLNINTAALADGSKAICVFVNDDLSAVVLDKLHALGVELIALRCAGFNNVDLKRAAELNIDVVRVPAYSPRAVAEHAVALMLTANRKTHKAYNRVREHNFSLENLVGFDMLGKTVGVIGTGKIGDAFCRIMLGFGCRVLAFDVYENEELKKIGVQYSDVNTLFAESDILSLHCPLTPETRHIIRGETIAKMKDGVMIVNTSRGALIHTRDTIHALKKGKIGHLAIDVYEQEEELFFRDLSNEIIQDDEIARLISFPNVLITAHQGFFTQEALSQIAQTTINNISEFMDGAELTNRISE